MWGVHHPVPQSAAVSSEYRTPSSWETCGAFHGLMRDGSTRFCRSSMQRGWITPEEGRVLEDVFVSDAKQTIYFLGRPRMVEESGKALVASRFQPLFHVRHAVGGSEQAPLNLWSIVLLTNAPDPRYYEPFE